MKHKHTELIHAWADGAEIEWRAGIDIWVEVSSPQWDDEREYRVKPEPKPDVVLYACSSVTHIRWATKAEANLELIYDGDTLKLKGSQVIK